MKKFVPTKVKFHPMIVDECETLIKYMDSKFIGPWADWVKVHFSDLYILQHHQEKLQQSHVYSTWFYYTNSLSRDEQEILAAVRLAEPYRAQVQERLANYYKES